MNAAVPTTVKAVLLADPMDNEPFGKRKGEIRNPTIPVTEKITSFLSVFGKSINEAVFLPRKKGVA